MSERRTKKVTVLPDGSAITSVDLDAVAPVRNRSRAKRHVAAAPGGGSIEATLYAAEDGGAIEFVIDRDSAIAAGRDPQQFNEVCEAIERRFAWVETAIAIKQAHTHEEVAPHARRALGTYLTGPHARANRLSLAGTTLEVIGADKDPEAKAGLATEIGASDLLEQAIAEHLGKVAVAIDALEGEVCERGGCLAWDAIVADHAAQHGAFGTSLAKAIRKSSALRWGARAERPAHDLFRLWLVTDDAITPPAIAEFAKVLWRSVVVPLLERVGSRIRFPTDLAQTFALARRGGGIFAPSASTIQVKPAKGVALFLPFDDGVQLRGARSSSERVSLRTALGPSALRTYCATLVLYQDAGARDKGDFDCDGPGTILDCMGATRQADHGKSMARYHGKEMKTVRSHLELFQRVSVCQVGELASEPGDALLTRNHLGGRTVGYAHARLIVGALQNSYLQIPRVVCQLDANDVPMALGIASVVRDRAMRMLKEKAKVEASITDWLEASGENWRAESAKRGAGAYWPKVIARLERIAEDARFGVMSVAGAGRETVLSLDVRGELREGYAPLLEAAKKHSTAARKALVAEKMRSRARR